MHSSTLPNERSAGALSPSPSVTRRISWGAILAGVTIALSLQLLLNLLGIGIGASTIDVRQGETPGSGMAISAGIWFAISAILSLLAGGWSAGRLAGVTERKDGMLHGFTTWSLSTILTLLLLSSAIGGLIGGSASLLRGATSAIGSGASSLSPAVTDLVSQATGVTPADVKQQAGDVASDPRFQTFASQIVTQGSATPNARHNLVSLVAQKQGISPEQANTEVDSWQQKLEQGKEKAKNAATSAADMAAAGLSRTALWSFLALLLGAIAATFGGFIGTQVAYRFLVPAAALRTAPSAEQVEVASVEEIHTHRRS